MAVAIYRRVPRPSHHPKLRVGHVNAAFERLDRLADEFGLLSKAHRLAAAHFVLAENSLDQVERALDRGDLEGARKHARKAREEFENARHREDRVSTLADSFSGMVKHWRNWLRKVGA